MAAVATTETCKVTINDVEIDVPKGELVVEAVKRLGLEIPVFCYHSRMKPVGMCRMCLVEVGFKQPDGSVRKMPKPQAGCTLPVSEGMVVYTDSDMVRRDRKGVLEFLLVNHPLDCPICDRGGECPLQNNTLAYGPSTSRFLEMKRHLPKAYPLSEHVVLDLERCIQCGRCVRFTEEISGDHQLAFRFRGASMQPSTFQLTNFQSKFSGNVIEICPVGALTSSHYRFRARPWDIEARPALCTLTPDGTNVWMDTRAGKLVRVTGRTNEAVNEEWTCDKTKFGHDIVNSPDRIKSCHVRDGAGFRAVTWGEAYKELAREFKGKGAETGLLVDADLSNETMYVARQVAAETLKTPNLDHRPYGAAAKKGGSIKEKFGVDEVQTSIAELEGKKAILVFGCDLSSEQPMTYLRVRKAWSKFGAKVSSVGVGDVDTDSFAGTVAHVATGTWAKAALALASEVGVSGASSRDGLDREASKGIAADLGLGDGAIICTDALFETEDGVKAAEVLAAVAHKTGAAFQLLRRSANSRGAEAIGVVPGDEGLDTKGMLEACVTGKVKALWLVGGQLLDEVQDRDLVTRALEAVEYLVVQASGPCLALEYASLILPLAMAPEQEGTYTSSEGRVQHMNAPLKAPGEAKPAWQALADFGFRSDTSFALATNSCEAVFDQLAGHVTDFQGLSYGKLAGEGVLLPRLVSTGDWGALAGTLSSI